MAFFCPPSLTSKQTYDLTQDQIDDILKFINIGVCGTHEQECYLSDISGAYIVIDGISPL